MSQLVPTSPSRSTFTLNVSETEKSPSNKCTSAPTTPLTRKQKRLRRGSMNVDSFAQQVIEGMHAIDRTYRTVSGQAGEKLRCELQDYLEKACSTPPRYDNKNVPHDTPTYLNRIFTSVSGTAGEKLHLELRRRQDLGSPFFFKRQQKLSSQNLTRQTSKLQSLFRVPGDTLTKDDGNKLASELEMNILGNPNPTPNQKGQKNVRKTSNLSTLFPHKVVKNSSAKLSPAPSMAMLGYDQYGIITFCNDAFRSLLHRNDKDACFYHKFRIFVFERKIVPNNIFRPKKNIFHN